MVNPEQPGHGNALSVFPAGTSASINTQDQAQDLGKAPDTGKFPLVSIITPAYNRASLLDETIQSVLSQDYPKVEYIVFDDGSTDETLSVIKKYEGRLRWETHDNIGETRTVNKGFSLAQGEIIGVVNSDDPLLPGAISTMVARMRAEPDLLVVYPDWQMIDAEGAVIQQIATSDYSYVDMLRWFHCMPGPGALFRRAVVEQLGGRTPKYRYVADFEFWLRAGLLGPFARVPQALATFRTHPGSATTSQRGAAMAEEYAQLVEEICSRPDLPAAVQKIRREAYSSAYYYAGHVCGDNAPTAQKKRYYLRALCYSPRKYLSEHRHRLVTLLPPLLGRFYPPLKALYRQAIRMRRHGTWERCRKSARNT